MISLASILKSLWSVLTFGITLPVWALIAAWVFFHSEKSAAVKDAVRELVAGAQIDAMQATLDNERKLRVAAEGEAKALKDANARFEKRAYAALVEQERIADELDDLKSRPAPDGCVVDQPLIDRLRKQ